MLVALDRHEFVERKAYDAQIAHAFNDVRGCFAVVRALHGGEKPRSFRARSLNFIAIDLLKVARMNTARIWIRSLRQWMSRLPDVVGTKVRSAIQRGDASG